jgi:hypothetical protein
MDESIFLLLWLSSKPSGLKCLRSLIEVHLHITAPRVMATSPTPGAAGPPSRPTHTPCHLLQQRHKAARHAAHPRGIRHGQHGRGRGAVQGHIKDAGGQGRRGVQRHGGVDGEAGQEVWTDKGAVLYPPRPVPLVPASENAGMIGRQKESNWEVPCATLAAARTNTVQAAKHPHTMGEHGPGTQCKNK